MLAKRTEESSPSGPEESAEPSARSSPLLIALLIFLIRARASWHEDSDVVVGTAIICSAIEGEMHTTECGGQ